MPLKGKLGTDPRDGSKRMGQLNHEAQEFADAQSTVTRCGVEGCSWRWEGPAGEGRDLFAAHRRLQHKDQMPEPPRDPLLDVVRDIIGHGETLEIRLPEMPVKWRADWIKRLGGRIVIDPSAPMPLQMRRDKNESNGHSEVEGLDALAAMDAGEPQPRERTEAMPELNQCKIDGCHEEALATRGRFANLCETHKAERLEEARREGTLTGRASRPAPAPPPEPEPELSPAAELVPVTPPPLAPRDPEKVDTFELFESLATQERIDYYEEVARQSLVKAQALRQIREQLAAVV